MMFVRFPRETGMKRALKILEKSESITARTKNYLRIKYRDFRFWLFAKRHRFDYIESFRPGKIKIKR